MGGLEVELPANTDCRGVAVIAKTTVVEDAAAANMLAEALRALSPGGKQRCLLDAGSQSAAARSSARLANTVYVVGGPSAIPDSRLQDQFGVTTFVRVAGADRWQTQENVAAAILALANGNAVKHYDPASVTAATLDLPANGDCHATAVLAKLTIPEERAAANMLAVALTAISGNLDNRCLVDVGDPGADRPPSAVSVAEAALASGAYLLGGTAAVPQAWIDNGFDIRFLERISGPDRWQTQAAVAQTIIDIAKGGTLPHQYIDDNGDLIAVYDDYIVSEAHIASSPLDTQVVTMHYCASSSKLDSKEAKESAESVLKEVIDEANRSIADFFGHQSGGTVSFKFEQAESLIELADNAWGGPFGPPGPSDEGASYKCVEAAVENDGLGGYVLVDQHLGGPSGWAKVGHRIGAQPTPQRFADNNSPGEFFSTLAHELGHGWLGLHHPHDKATELHNMYVFKEELKDDPYGDTYLHLCSILSYCYNHRGHVHDYDAATGGPTFVACGQRKILDWPDGPPTPYGICKAGMHILHDVPNSLPQPRILNVVADWPSNREQPLVTVFYDKSEWPRCASHVQVSFDKEGWFNFDDAQDWKPINSRQRLSYDRDRDSKYSVTLKYRCLIGGNDFKESEWSEPRIVSTPKNRAGRPDAPGKPNLSSAEDRYLSVTWQEASGVVVRHEVQWRIVGASSWQARTLNNDLAIFGTDGLRSGLCYDFRVRAGNGGGWSSWSPTAEICTTGTAELPQIAGLQLAADSASIRVTWSVPLVYAPAVLDNVRGFKIEWGCETSHIAPLGRVESASASARSFTIDGLAPGASLPNGRSCKVRVAAVGPNGEAGKFTDWEAVTVKPRATSSVRIAEGSANATRTANGQCSGRDCRDLQYTIDGLGSGPYTLECWFNDQQLWSGAWSGNASTGCYYSAAFGGTIHVVVDGVQSNTLTVTAKRAAASPPGEPPNFAVAARDRQLSLSWEASASNGSPVTGYTVGWSGGGVSDSRRLGPSARSHTITGLTNGVGYTVSVVAHSAVGDSRAAALAAFPKAAARVPDAPRGLSLAAGDGEIEVSWRASSANGSPVTGYLVAWSDGTVVGGKTVSASARRYTITGLRDGVRYEVEVVAQSSAGTSPPATAHVTTRAAVTASAPDAPSRPTLRDDDGSVLVSWSAPDDNGAAIDLYEVRHRRSGRSSWSDWDGSGSSRRLRITGTSAGATYEVGVRAHNSEGWGPWSSTATLTTQQARTSNPQLTVRRGSLKTDSGTCPAARRCRWVTGAGSGWPADEQFWIKCGTFVDTSRNIPVRYRDRFVDANGNLSWGESICYSNFAHSIEVWTSSGVRKTVNVQ